jgi:hypothetical protein
MQSASQGDPNELPPPWAKHPEIPWGSIGWRMGYGESALMEWHAWFDQQPWGDREQRVAYLRRHAAAPRPWAWAVAGVLEPDRDEDEGDDDYDGRNEALATRLAAEGLVGDDVAMGAWEAIHGDAPVAPWAASWRGRVLGSAARYGGRELTFWARWCAARRDDGRLAAWLQRVPAPEPAWEPMRDAVQHGAPPRGFSPASAWERLAVLVAAHAAAPPPWSVGEPPSALREEYEDDSSYADAWRGWVYEAFDDGASWRAYLGRHGGVPVEWREVIERVIWIGG